MKRILIVDDTSFMRVALRDTLTNNGFDVVGEAVNGVEAVQKYFELNPDIITLDITMPIMDGIEALREIRSRDPKVKAIMVSAMGQESLIRKSILSGARGFIVKPYDEQYIVDALNELD